MYKKLLGSLFVAVTLMVSFTSVADADTATATRQVSSATVYACWNGPNHPNHPTIGYGNQGWDVIEAQCRMREFAGCFLNADGLFGTNTRNCTIAIQRWCKAYTGRRDIAIDGVIGPVTWRMIHAYSCWA